MDVEVSALTLGSSGRGLFSDVYWLDPTGPAWAGAGPTQDEGRPSKRSAPRALAATGKRPVGPAPSCKQARDAAFSSSCSLRLPDYGFGRRAPCLYFWNDLATHYERLSRSAGLGRRRKAGPDVAISRARRPRADHGGDGRDILKIDAWG